MVPEQYRTHLSKILSFIDDNDNFLISGHINADGDAIASVIAFQLLLQKLKKHSIMLFHDPVVDRKFSFLSGYKNIVHCNSAFNLHKYLPAGKIEAAIILDVPAFKRLGDVEQWLPSKQTILKIDHHPVEDVMGPIDWVDSNASSTTALVYEVIEASGITIDRCIAEAIFSGIVYDTGRFSFSNTTARDFEICSQMVRLGAKPSAITGRIFFENSFTALKLIGNGLCSLESYLGGLVNVIFLNNQQMQNADHGEIEELASYSVAVRGGYIGLFIREVEPGHLKISFRSRNRVDVNIIAKKFGGGGHARAAGCRLQGSKDEVVSKIIDEIELQLADSS